jgi:SAM-dependent methyltransferase
MMRILRHLVRYNRKGSAWIASRFPKIFASPDPSYRATVLGRVTRDIKANQPKLVLEAGGVDRPLLDRSPDYEFVGLDIEERPECARLYDRFVIQSIEEPLPVEPDMILSFTLLEHVPNNHAAIRQMYSVLKPAGTIHHYVPSKYHPYSLGLRLIGPGLQKRLIPVLRPGAEDVTGYPAFFDLCSANAMSRALERQGFKNIDVKAFYRANDYFAFFTPLFVLVTLWENLCHKLEWRIFASGFVISARK